MADDITRKILEMRGACNNKKARQQFENQTLRIFSSPFHLKGYLPNYKNDVWRDLNIEDRGREKEDENTRSWECREKTHLERKPEDTQESENRSCMETEDLMQQEKGEVTREKRGRDGEENTPNSENKDGMDMSRTKDVHEGDNKHTTRLSAASKRKNEGDSDRRESATEIEEGDQTEEQEKVNNKPLTVKEIQAFIENMPSGNHKRKAAEQETKNQKREMRDKRAPNECKEYERRKSKTTEKKEAKAMYQEEEYLTDKQIEAFIGSLGRNRSDSAKMEGQSNKKNEIAEEENEEGYTQVGGSSGSGNRDEDSLNENRSRSKANDKRDAIDLTGRASHRTKRGAGDELVTQGTFPIASGAGSSDPQPLGPANTSDEDSAAHLAEITAKLKMRVSP